MVAGMESVYVVTEVRGICLKSAKVNIRYLREVSLRDSMGDTEALL